jgi:ribonuclease E
MMPGMRQLGVSRKIEDEEERRKLRDQLQELSLPENMGFIARTAALDRTKRELQGDLNYLSRLWKAVERRIKKQKPPTEIYTESDLMIRTIRDVYTSDIARILVDDPEVARRAHEFLAIFSPRARDTVVEYTDPEPIFHRYGIEAELERLHTRQVPLKSGGSLVIDQTEALVAIDVNSGRFRTEEDAETTAYKINLEAADEIPRQLRLRDLGGVVICDFIDMRQQKHKREIERRLAHNLKEHKERAKILRMSDFGIIEMTRQRQRASLTHSVYEECKHCHGTGLVKTPESVVLDIMRRIQLAATRENIRKINVFVSREVADRLQNEKRAQLSDLETRNRCSVFVRAQTGFGLDQTSLECYDRRERLVPDS